jgi:hypothetical protein
MSYLLNYKNWRAIHEAAIFESAIGRSVQDSLAKSMDQATKTGLAEFQMAETGSSSKTIDNLTKNIEPAIKTSIGEILAASQEYDEDKEGYNPLVSISTTVKSITFNNAMGLNVPYNTADKNGTWNNGWPDTGNRPVSDLLAATSGANLRLFFDQVSTSVNNSAGSAVGVDKWNTELFAITGGSGNTANIIQKADDILSIAPDDNLPNSFGGTFASGQALSKYMGKDGYLYVQGVIYTFGGFNPQAGADLSISDTVSTVNVTTDEVSSTAEEALTNANEVFVVGKETYVDPKGGPAKLKTAIQTIFNKFKSIKSIKVVGGASNEGGDALNQALVGKRATAVANLIATSWPELKAAVSADTANFSKIQPAGGDPDPNFRSIYLNITGTKVTTKETKTTSVDLALSTFKKDQIIINEYLMTAKLDATQSALWLKAKPGFDKIEADVKKTEDEKKAQVESVAKQLSKTKADYAIRIKSKSDPDKIVNVTVAKVEGGKIFIKNPTEGGAPIPLDSERFVGWTEDQAKIVAKEEKAKAKSGAAGEEDI